MSQIEGMLRFRDGAAAVVAPEHIVEESALLDQYGKDHSFVSGRSPSLVVFPETKEHVQAIVSAGDPPSAAERERLARLSQVLAVPMEKPAAPAMSGRSYATRANARPDAVLH